MKMFRLTLALLPIALLAAPGSVERIKVHGPSLVGNLSGDSPDRDVSIWLPPAYKTETGRRFPVIYMLHGFTDSDEKWFGLVKHWINLPSILDEAQPQAIVVMPNAFTRFHGSMYSSSATTGDWERYVSEDLVRYIDSHYRTIPNVASRGLAGHSMGGYGAMRIGMKRPDVFGSIYLLSPCCMLPGPAQRNSEIEKKVAAVREPADVDKADFITKIILASAAAWSPNPAKAPFFVDLPVENDQPNPQVTAKWTANLPLAMVDQYISNLRKLRGIGMDSGTKDEPIATGVRTLDATLSAYKVDHRSEIYEGDHLNRIAERITTKVLPFFAEHLAAQ